MSHPPASTPLRTENERLSWRESLAVTLSGAALAGCMEAANAVYRHRVSHLPTGEFVAGEIFWMAPLAAMVFLGGLWLLWQALAKLTPTRWEVNAWAPPLTAAVATYSLLSAMALGIAVYAKLLVSAGVGVSLHRLLGAQRARVGATARAIVLAAPLLLGAVAVAVPWQRSRAQARALAALPTAAPNAPNVLVLIWDTARALNMSLYGYSRRTTPVLDSVAKHGVTFDYAFATSPWSLPSHASIFTGRYPHEFTAGSRIPLDTTHPTAAEWFSSRGYATAGITANLFYGSADYGIGRGFSMYDARPPIRPGVIAHTYLLFRQSLLVAREATGNHDTILRRRASHVNATFERWLDHRDGRPFLAMLTYFDAHEPYRAPAPFDTVFARRGARYWVDETILSLPPAVTGELLDMYDGGIRYTDHSFGELLASLRERGLLDNTVLVVTSDHGEEFAEHGPTLIGHNRSVFRQALQVPLVIVYPPRVAGPQRQRAVASIRDIPATIADLALPGTDHPFPGTSLARLTTDSIVADTSDVSRLAMTEKHRWANNKKGWPSSWGDLYTVLDPDGQYVIDAFGSESLFDLATDRQGTHNVAGDPSRAPLISRLRARLDRYVGPRATRVPRAGARPRLATAAAPSSQAR